MKNRSAEPGAEAARPHGERNNAAAPSVRLERLLLLAVGYEGWWQDRVKLCVCAFVCDALLPP